MRPNRPESSLKKGGQSTFFYIAHEKIMGSEYILPRCTQIPYAGRKMYSDPIIFSGPNFSVPATQALMGHKSTSYQNLSAAPAAR